MLPLSPGSGGQWLGLRAMLGLWQPCSMLFQAARKGPGKTLPPPPPPPSCHALCPSLPVCFALPSLSALPPFLVSFYHCSFILFSALSTFLEREQLGCRSHRGNIFLTTLQIPHLYEN